LSLALSAIEALALDIVIVATSTPLPPSAVVVQKVTPVAKVDASATLAGFIAAFLSTVVILLLSVNVVTTSALVMSSPLTTTPPVPPSTVLVATSPSYFSRPHVSLDQLYASNDVDSLWVANYKPVQKTPTSFVSAFDRNLIRSTRL